MNDSTRPVPPVWIGPDARTRPGLSVATSDPVRAGIIGTGAARPSLGKLATLLFACTVSATSHAAVLALKYDTGTESKTLVTPITPGSSLSLEGLVAPGTVNSSLAFNWASTSDFSLGAAWLVGAAADTTPSLTGFNIDLFDSGNALVASDSFAGLTAGIARSSLQFGSLAAGAYRLAVTGTAVRTGIFDVDLNAGPTLPPLANPPVAVPDTGHLTYDTIFGSKAIAAPFTVGDSLLLDGDSMETGALLNDTVIRLDTGTFSAGLRWVVNSASGTDARLIGVNLDLFDPANLLVASDAFTGVEDGQALSSLVTTGLAPGTYRLRMTGTSVRGARYQLALATDATPPSVPPIDMQVSVPAPAAWAFTFVGLGMACLRARRKQQRRDPASNKGPVA